MYLLPKVASIRRPITQLLKEHAPPWSEPQGRQLLYFQRQKSTAMNQSQIVQRLPPKCVNLLQFDGALRNDVYKPEWT